MIAIAEADRRASLALSEKRRSDLRRFVFQPEVDVARGGPGEIGNLALDPEAGESLVEQGLDATIELADRLSFLKGTPRISLVGGGVPIRIAGYMYGAVGISGAPAEKTPGDVDDECARAGVDAVKEALEFAG